MALVYIFTVVIVIIIITIIIIIITTFMQGIYNYIPQTNHVSSLYSVAAVLYLQFVLYVMLFCKLNMFYTFHSMCAVPSMAVFCISLISCFPGMLLRYCLSDFEKVPVTPIIACLVLLLLLSFAVDGVDYCNIDTSTGLINASLLTIYLLLHTRSS